MKTVGKTDEIARQRQFCTFRIDQKLFGVEITDVKEVRPPDRFTPVFHASDEVRGVVNVRGHIHLVIDLRVLLGLDRVESGKLSRIVLFKSHVGESFGILVDAIGDVVEADENRIENMGEKNRGNGSGGMGDLANLSMGNCKLDGKILIILESAALLRKIRELHRK